MKTKLQKGEGSYFIKVYDNDPYTERVLEAVEIMRTHGKDFYPRRRYPDHIDYTVTLDEETVTFLLMTFGDVLSKERYF